MNKGIIFFVIVYFFSHNHVQLAANQQPIIIQPQPNNITVNNNFIPTFIIHIPENLKKMTLGMLKSQALTLKNLIYIYCSTHKEKLFLGTLASTYITIHVSLFYFYYKIMRRTTWSCWKDSLTNEMLIAIPPQELGKELIFAVQQRYQTPKNLADFLVPLIAFLNDVDQELALLNKFLKMHHYLHIAHLNALFPSQETLIQIAHEKIERLTYLREIFLHWVTDYKITVNTHS